jgi:hypothetical protein
MFPHQKISKNKVMNFKEHFMGTTSKFLGSLEENASQYIECCSYHAG